MFRNGGLQTRSVPRTTDEHPQDYPAVCEGDDNIVTAASLEQVAYDPLRAAADVLKGLGALDHSPVPPTCRTLKAICG